MPTRASSSERSKEDGSDASTEVRSLTCTLLRFVAVPSPVAVAFLAQATTATVFKPRLNSRHAETPVPSQSFNMPVYTTVKVCKAVP